EQAGMTPGGGPVLVTGATGGVGSVAVKLLAHLGHEVHAVAGKASQHDFLRGLGAAEILGRDDALAGAERPLLRETWGGVVELLTFDTLSAAIDRILAGDMVGRGLVDLTA
ncbi:MAG: NAD-dependent epimerase/dehydratase family protein, partial [Gammaproteobacteria bacterium]|nr:NAD-dependent epimerase/dehydratase family protein [Gammaproteobacteria bacterium]